MWALGAHIPRQAPDPEPTGSRKGAARHAQKPDWSSGKHHGIANPFPTPRGNDRRPHTASIPSHGAAYSPWSQARGISCCLPTEGHLCQRVPVNPRGHVKSQRGETGHRIGNKQNPWQPRPFLPTHYLPSRDWGEQAMATLGNPGSRGGLSQLPLPAQTDAQSRLPETQPSHVRRYHLTGT